MYYDVVSMSGICDVVYVVWYMWCGICGVYVVVSMRGICGGIYEGYMCYSTNRRLAA